LTYQIIEDRRDGRWVYYSLVPEAVDEMRAFLGVVHEDVISCRDTGCC